MLILFATVYRHPSPWLQVVLCLFGGVLGWVIGIATTPLSVGERKRFSDFAKAISAVISGFVIAKLGVIINPLAEKLGESEGEVLLFRVLLFGTSLLIGFLFPFINRLYLQERSFDPLIANYDEVIARNPKNAPYYDSRGFAYYGKGDYGRAIVDYTKAITLDPKFAAAYFNRGVAYDSKGDKDQAIADLKKALEIEPSHQDARNNLKRLEATL